MECVLDILEVTGSGTPAPAELVKTKAVEFRPELGVKHNEGSRALHTPEAMSATLSTSGKEV